MPNVLIIDDDETIRSLLKRLVEQTGHRSAQAGTLGAALACSEREPFDVALLDLQLPDGNGLDILPRLLKAPGEPEVIIITGTGDPRGAELAFRHGAWDFIEKPFSLDEVSLTLKRALQFREEKKLAERPRLLKRDKIIGGSSELQAALELVAQAAVTDTSVLITGETGTGKELFAWAIHDNSDRAKGNFVVVDCTVLPDNLVESTLFGHEKGAFTGADRGHEGLILQADGGTLFLDEVGELPLHIQKSFLRVLQERRFRTVGGSREMSSDFRLVAATNRDLDEMVEKGQFRQDLLYRIRAMHVALPPLRVRKGDIQDLVIQSLARLCRQYGREIKGFTPEFLMEMESYGWPGNVRELLSVLETALGAAGQGPTLYPKHLPAAVRLSSLQGQAAEPEPSGPSEPTVPGGLGEGDLPSLKDYRETAVANAESYYLRELLQRTGGDVKVACEISELSKSRLYALLKKYQIET